jgi:hypothetical protein
MMMQIVDFRKADNFANFLHFLNYYSAVQKELAMAYTMKKIKSPPLSKSLSFLMFPSIELFSLVYRAIMHCIYSHKKKYSHLCFWHLCHPFPENLFSSPLFSLWPQQKRKILLASRVSKTYGKNNVVEHTLILSCNHGPM